MVYLHLPPEPFTAADRESPRVNDNARLRQPRRGSLQAPVALPDAACPPPRRSGSETITAPKSVSPWLNAGGRSAAHCTGMEHLAGPELNSAEAILLGLDRAVLDEHMPPQGTRVACALSSAETAGILR